MKPKAFLTVVLLMLTSIFSWGQNPVRTITASFDKIPLSEAIKTIESTSDYRFFYEIENIDFTQKVSLKAKAMPAEQAVGKMLSTTDLDFKIVAQQIVLFKKKTVVAGQSGEVLVNGTIVDINGEPLIGVVVPMKAAPAAPCPMLTENSASRQTGTTSFSFPASATIHRLFLPNPR